MMCWNANPVTQAPETEKIIKGLQRDDLFLVSAEHFVSDTGFLRRYFATSLYGCRTRRYDIVLGPLIFDL